MMTDKLKKSAENVVLPDDAKERIIKNVSEAVEKAPEISYSENVAGVERVRSRNTIRIISGLAACAVIAGGAGLFAHNMSRKAPSSPTASSEVTTDEVVVTEPLSDEPADPSSLEEALEYVLAKDFYADVETGDFSASGFVGTMIELSPEQRAEIAGIVRGASYSEVPEEEFAPFRIVDGDDDDCAYYNLSLSYRSTSDPDAPEVEFANLILYRNGYAAVNIVRYEAGTEIDYTSSSSEPSRIKHNIANKYLKFDEDVSQKIAGLDYIAPACENGSCAPFEDFRTTPFKVYAKNSNEKSEEGLYPQKIELTAAGAGGYIYADDAGKALSADEREKLADLFDSTKFELNDKESYASDYDMETIRFSYIDNSVLIRVVFYENGTMEYIRVPYKWDGVSDAATVDVNNPNFFISYVSETYKVDYEAIKAGVVEILGEDAVCPPIDGENNAGDKAAAPFGKLADKGIDIMQNEDGVVDFADAPELLKLIDDYLASLEWKETNDEDGSYAQGYWGSFFYGRDSENYSIAQLGGNMLLIDVGGDRKLYECVSLPDDEDVSLNLRSRIRDYAQKNSLSFG